MQPGCSETRNGTAVEDSKQTMADKENIEIYDGGAIRSVVITRDNKRVCVACGRQVAVHDAQSGHREFTVTETCDVVNISTSCKDPNKVFIYLTNGFRIEHHLGTNTVIECRDLHQPSLLAAFEETHSQSVFAICGDEQLENLSVTRVTLEDGEERLEKLIKNDSFQIPKLDTMQQLAICDIFLAVCEDLWVRAYIFENDISRAYKFTGKEEFDGVRSCFVAVRAFRGVSLVATLSFGRVLVWDNVVERMGAPSQCVHWHRLAPSVVLTPQGALVSGGVEGVVVKYAARGSRTGSRADSFLSRVGAAIKHVGISEDGSLLVAVLMDHSVVIVLLSTMTVYSRLETLQRPLICARKFAVTADPLMPHLVVHNGRPGCIQWINPCTMLTVAVLDVASQNLPEVIRLNPLMMAPHMDVSAVAMNRTTIMTAEQRVGDAIKVHVLKFWRRDAARIASVEFSTLYDSSIHFARSSDAHDDMFVSIDAVGKLTAWERCEHEGGYVVWVPVRSASWKRLHVSEASQICDSRLGTIHDWDGEKSTVVVWRIACGERIDELAHYDTNNHLSSLEWCAPPQQHILIVCSATEVLAFDTFASLFRWSALQPGLMLGLFPDNSIAYNDREVIVFDGEVGVEKRSQELRDKAVSVVGTSAGNQWSLFVAYPQSYVSFLCQHAHNIRVDKNGNKNDGRTPFARLRDRRGTNADSLLPNAGGRITLEGNAALGMLKGPSHSIAPVPKIALSFIESCLLPSLPDDGTE